MRIKSIYITAAVLLIFCMFSYFNSFEGLESNMQDAFLQESFLKIKDKVDSRIAILAIDDPSIDRLGKWMWPRDVIAEGIEKLSKGGPAVIGVDIIYSEESSDNRQDETLIKAVKSAGNVVLPFYGDFGNKKGTEPGKRKAISLKEPFKALNAAAAAVAHINTEFDNDYVVRWSPVSFDYKGRDIKSFGLEICNMYLKKIGKPPLQENIPVDIMNRMFISYAGNPGKIEHHSFYKILNGEIPADYFKDKIVLIGPYTVGISDAYLTPTDHAIPMYGVEIHANIIQALLNKSFKHQLPDIANLVLLVLISILGYVLFKKLSPAKSAGIVAAFSLLYILASEILYEQGLILQLFYPIVLFALIYLVMLAYRYLEEYFERKRVTDVFGKYVAPQVVSQILDGGEDGLRLGGCRREVTLLFVDIRGFTPMSEKVEPEQVVEILNDYLDLCARSIFEYGGTLDKFIGDATMAIFNAPLDLEDHVFRAVQTAWMMKKGSEVLQKGLEEKFGRSVSFGVGINTGFAVVGNIGAKFRMDYTAIGDTVNTAARLESNAKPGQILMSEAVYEKVKDRIDATYMGEYKMKGKESGLPVYQLDGIK